MAEGVKVLKNTNGRWNVGDAENIGALEFQKNTDFEDLLRKYGNADIFGTFGKNEKLQSGMSVLSKAVRQSDDYKNMSEQERNAFDTWVNQFGYQGSGFQNKYLINPNWVKADNALRQIIMGENYTPGKYTMSKLNDPSPPPGQSGSWQEATQQADNYVNPYVKDPLLARARILGAGNLPLERYLKEEEIQKLTTYGYDPAKRNVEVLKTVQTPTVTSQVNQLNTPMNIQNGQYTPEVANGKLGQGIEKNIRTSIEKGELFDTNMPWQDYFNRTAVRNEVSQDLDTNKYNTLRGETAEVLRRDRRDVDSRISRSGLIGGGGGSRYWTRMLMDDFGRNVNKLEQARETELGGMVADRESDARKIYNEMRQNQDSQNYIKTK